MNSRSENKTVQLEQRRTMRVCFRSDHIECKYDLGREHQASVWKRLLGVWVKQRGVEETDAKQRADAAQVAHQ